MATAADQQAIAEQRKLLTQKFVESGEKEKLKVYLRTKLSSNEQWQESLKRSCREKLEKRSAEEPITIDWILSEIAPQARALVPNEIKADLLAQVKKYIAAQVNQKN